jgi:SHS2 domain-containing protein
MSDHDEDIKARLADRRPPSAGPTRTEIKAMTIERLREIFDAGAWPVTVTWDDVLQARQE